MLRLLNTQDLPDLLRIETACQRNPWSEDAFKKCLEAGSIAWVVESEAKIVGFIIFLFQVEEGHILNFCVHPHYQHQGLGKQLIMHVLQLMKNLGGKLAYLEVRRSNQRAIALYENAGFIQVGERKDYYVSLDHKEDALVFAKDLTE